MAEKKMPPSLLECGCGRLGYALILCQEHAPIPFTVTERGHRDARAHGDNMKQWDAIKDSLVESAKARELLLRGARREGRKLEGRERRRNGAAVKTARSAAARKAWETRRNNGSTPA